MERTKPPFNQNSEMLLIEAFKSTGYLTINKTLIKQMGLLPAAMLSNLIDKYIYFRDKYGQCGGEFKGWFFLTHENQTEQIGLSDHQIRKTKKELLEKDFIQTRREGIPAKEWYKINFNILYKGLVLKNLKDLPFKNQRTYIKENKYNNNKENTTSSEKEIPAVKNNGAITPKQFEDFWQLYPKKVDKGKALTVWEKICRKSTNERPTWHVIKHAVLVQIKSERWQDKQYIPHPTTWLNQKRWLDDPKQMKSYNRDEKPQYLIRFGEKWNLAPDGEYYNDEGLKLDHEEYKTK